MMKILLAQIKKENDKKECNKKLEQENQYRENKLYKK